MLNLSELTVATETCVANRCFIVCQGLKKSDGVMYAIKEIRLDDVSQHDVASSVYTFRLILFYFIIRYDLAFR